MIVKEKIVKKTSWFWKVLFFLILIGLIFFIWFLLAPSSFNRVVFGRVVGVNETVQNVTGVDCNVSDTQERGVVEGKGSGVGVFLIILISCVVLFFIIYFIYRVSRKGGFKRKTLNWLRNYVATELVKDGFPVFRDGVTKRFATRCMPVGNGDYQLVEVCMDSYFGKGGVSSVNDVRRVVVLTHLDRYNEIFGGWYGRCIEGVEKMVRDYHYGKGGLSPFDFGKRQPTSVELALSKAQVEGMLEGVRDLTKAEVER